MHGAAKKRILIAFSFPVAASDEGRQLNLK
jgi:hypothetical protein